MRGDHARVPHPLPQPAPGLQEHPLLALSWGLSALDNHTWGASLDHSWQPGQKSPEMTGSVCARPGQRGDGGGGDSKQPVPFESSRHLPSSEAHCGGARVVLAKPRWGERGRLAEVTKDRAEGISPQLAGQTVHA